MAFAAAAAAAAFCAAAAYDNTAVNPRTGPRERPETAVAVVPVAEKLLVVDGAENLVFEDVTFGHSGYRVPDSLFTRQSAFLLDAAVELRNARHDERHGGHLHAWRQP